MDFAMRFDLVDLQLFIAVAETRSITSGAQRVHLALASASERIKGLEDGLGVAAHARPARRRADGGRRKPARSRPHRHAQCRGDARRSACLCQRRQGHRSACSPTRRAFGISAEGAGRIPEPAPAYLDRCRGARKHRHRPRHPDRSRRSRARRRTRAAGRIERIPFSEDRLVLVAARDDELANRRQVDFREVVERISSA